MNDNLLRIRGFLGRYFGGIVIGLLVVMLLGGAVTYSVYANPDRTPQERVTASWAVTSDFTTSATVTEENPVFPVGTELDDRPVYFTRIAPVLDGVFTVAYSATNAEDVTVEIDLVLVRQSTDDETIYWSETESLDTITTDDVAPQESVEVPFAVNATDVSDRLQTIESELGPSPGDTEVFVRADIKISGIIEGEPTDHQTAARLPIEIGAAVYEVATTGPERATVDRTETVMVTQEYGPLLSIGGPRVMAIGIGGLFGIGLARSQGLVGLTDHERDYLRYRDDRSAFDEWITRISLPSEVFNRPTAEAATLGDLVDFAIDSEIGVVEDPDDGSFYVIREDVLYTFTPPSGSTESASDSRGESFTFAHTADSTVTSDTESGTESRLTLNADTDDGVLDDRDS